MTPGTSNKGFAEPVATRFLKIRGTFWWVTIIRIIVCQGLHGVPRIWKLQNLAFGRFTSFWGRFRGGCLWFLTVCAFDSSLHDPHLPPGLKQLH